MIDENQEILMSQLVDGELPGDQANELLLGVLDAPAHREKLKQFLRLRQMTAGHRNRQPERPVMIVADQPGTFRRRTAWRRVGGLAVAACVGGLLVLAGLRATGWPGSPVRPLHQWQIGPAPGAPPAVAQVTPEQMRQVARVFALHESVAGPLAWYAADDQNIRLASTAGTEAGQPPIAVLLKLGPAGPDMTARTLVIVCREDRPAIVELPGESPGQAGLRIYLAPRAVNGKVEVQYAIAVDGDEHQPAIASLAGQRCIGLAETPLGQLALGDRLINVEAAAWPVRQEGTR